MKTKRIKTVFIIVLLVLVLSIQATAVEIRSSPLIIDYNASIVESADGSIGIFFSISTNGDMTVLGASNITLQYRRTGTSTWYQTATYTLSNYSELQTSNDSLYRTTVPYGKPKSGYEYRAIVTFYASNGTTSDTKSYTTSIWP